MLLVKFFKVKKGEVISIGSLKWDINEIKVSIVSFKNV